MPKISVVVPCYNAEHYLSECLDSIVNQSFKDFEIVCVEDCSTDKTKQALEKYAKKYKNIRVICNDVNKGLAISRNVGMNNADGEYVLFVDSDDYVSDDCLEKLYNQISKDKCDVVMGAVKVYPENKHDDSCVQRCDSIKTWIKFKPFTKLQITKENSIEKYNELYCCAWNKLFRKSFLIDNDIYFINEKCFHEDNGFWLKVMTCNPLISGISVCTYFYRIRNSSITEMTSSDKNLHILHLKKSLQDALVFAKKKKNKKLSNFIYYEIYALKKHHLFYFVWTDFEKRLKFFSFPIFGLKLDAKNKLYKLKILGIPVYKWGAK